jgi:hypothetical protein
MVKQSLETAIAQLAETEIQTRLAAIYQLEKIADSWQYHCQAVEALINFVRNNALLTIKKVKLYYQSVLIFKLLFR